jgi:dihydrofolate synthase / folylpolyglutamate synthase
VKLSTLSSWLEWIGSVHNTEIDLGLERIRLVAGKLALLQPECTVIIIGGTNGKGSVVAGLEAVYLAAGMRTGAFTSPYLFVHNEEVRVNGKTADDDAFCRAFEAIEEARDGITLTPFEYHTLAALMIFKEANLDVMILEVGLGGRLDAVNIIDADAAVVTSIGIDHVDWLGDTRAAIAIEKAGIFRDGKPAVCGDANPPPSLAHAARETGAVFYQQGVDFLFTEDADTWTFRAGTCEYHDLPRNALLTENMATVLMTVQTLQQQLPVSEDALRRGLQQVNLPGRIQIISGPVIEILDVSHNPAAAAVLAKRLHVMPCAGKTVAVFSMLGDKDIAGTIAAIHEEIDAWFIAPLTCKRAAAIDKIKSSLLKLHIYDVQMCASITEAYQEARLYAAPGDRIIIFGSFYTVAAVMRLK